jgi:hypothetical protein
VFQFILAVLGAACVFFRSRHDTALEILALHGSRLLCSSGNGLVLACITRIECSGRHYAAFGPDGQRSWLL